MWDTGITQIALTPLFDAEYLRNGTIYTHITNRMHERVYARVCASKNSHVNSGIHERVQSTE